MSQEPHGRARAHPSRGGAAKPRNSSRARRVSRAASAGTSPEGSRTRGRNTRPAWLVRNRPGRTAMLARIRKAQEEREGGFTLIELLVVMIIIGILPPTAIRFFLTQGKKANTPAGRAAVPPLGKGSAPFSVDNNVFPAVTGPAGGRYTVAGADA